MLLRIDYWSILTRGRSVLLDFENLDNLSLHKNNGCKAMGGDINELHDVIYEEQAPIEQEVLVLIGLAA